MLKIEKGDIISSSLLCEQGTVVQIWWGCLTSSYFVLMKITLLHGYTIASKCPGSHEAAHKKMCCTVSLTVLRTT